MIFANTDQQILHLSGAISPVKRHYEDVLEGTIHLLPFAFISGSKLPDGKSIYETITTHSGYWFPEIVEFTRFGIFENEMKFTEKKNAILVGDVEIVPLVNSVFHFNPHMWQYFRWAHELRILGPGLSNSISPSPSSSGINYIKDGKSIAHVVDFADGIREQSTI